MTVDVVGEVYNDMMAYQLKASKRGPCEFTTGTFTKSWALHAEGGSLTGTPWS